MAVDKRNIFIERTEESIPYSSRQIAVQHNFPRRRDIYAHASLIERKLKECYKQSAIQKQAAAIRYKDGTYLEFSSATSFDLASKSLENISQGIRLLNIKRSKETDTIRATIYIPSGKESYFTKKIEEYRSEITKKGNPKNNNLVSSIEAIRVAILDSFWIGKPEDVPTEVPHWCEIWIRYGVLSVEDVSRKVHDCCETLEIIIDENKIVFPERIVFLVKANKSQLSSLIDICDYLTEIRRAPEPPSFFYSLSGVDQYDWTQDLLSRTEFLDSNSSVCLLDTGLNSSHPLIAPTIKDPSTIQAVNNSWRVDDHMGHGTEMAGIAIYCNLKDALLDNKRVFIKHQIESVKVIPPQGANPVELYGAITEQAVALAEISNPNVNRAICMAVTSSSFNTEDGSPTSWSSAVDSITSGANESGEKRLFLISSGNVLPHELSLANYPNSSILHGVENPGQSWNALTVGAITNDVQIVDSQYDGFKPVADVGELSPYSSTSVTWSNKWPIKPEILLDGGNMATNDRDYIECEDLSLLTTHNKPLNRLFTTTWGTSSATAQASWMAAQINAEYPGIWPETIRALLVHSARWTEKMRQQFCKDDTKKKGRRQLLRTCGYGVPNLSKAIQCANNSVNLIIQSELQPFSGNKMCEMHLHKIPWPKEVLRSLDVIRMTIRVTLSYFIEPGPGEVGWKDKYRYSSCALRFDVINTNESLEDFNKRINVQMRGDDVTDTGEGSSREWYLGVDNRNVGSIHSDYCEDLAVNLCDANYLAVYPVVGWWRERKHLGKSNNKVRYALIVSIETPEIDVDLYTAIVNAIKINSAMEVAIST